MHPWSRRPASLACAYLSGFASAPKIACRISGEMMTGPSICSRRPDDGTAAALVARLLPAAPLGARTAPDARIGAQEQGSSGSGRTLAILSEPELLAVRPCRPGPCSARPPSLPRVRARRQDLGARQRHGWRVAPCGRVPGRIRARCMSAATAFRLNGTIQFYLPVHFAAAPTTTAIHPLFVSFSFSFFFKRAHLLFFSFLFLSCFLFFQSLLNEYGF
jgi:hypothetical protein